MTPPTPPEGEYWVMRVVATEKEVAAAGANALGQFAFTPLWWAAYERGDLQLVNGEIVEPVEVYRDQHQASARAVKEHRRTGAAHKVVLNVEV